MSEGFNHFDKKGNAIMVDVSGKEETSRTAVAMGKIKVNQDIMEALKAGNVKKGDVLGVARVAGIMGVKNTASLIPMCHTLIKAPLSSTSPAAPRLSERASNT